MVVFRAVHWKAPKLVLLWHRNKTHLVFVFFNTVEPYQNQTHLKTISNLSELQYPKLKVQPPLSLRCKCMTFSRYHRSLWQSTALYYFITCVTALHRGVSQPLFFIVLLWSARKNNLRSAIRLHGRADEIVR